jgi:predicted NBD/HSP70 family sugar kinase
MNRGLPHVPPSSSLEDSRTPVIEQTQHLAGANIEFAGRHNERVVLQTIRSHAPITRSRIAAITGLTPATVTNITNRMLEAGLLNDAGRLRGGRGQPAAQLVVRPDGAYSIGLNVDRDHFTMVVVDFAGQVRARLSKPCWFPKPDEVREFVTDNADVLLAKAGIVLGDVVGLGVALPDDLGRLPLPGYAANEDRWSPVDAEALLRPILGVPVCIENDAAAAAIGEMHFGFGREVTRFFYLLLTVALGGGIVGNAQYDRGADGRSGEIGFLHINDGSSGGARVQLQSIVSLAGLAAALAAAGHEVVDVRSVDLADPVLGPTVGAWVERAAAALVEPLIAVNCLLNPQAILFGGRLPLPLLTSLIARTRDFMAARRVDMPSFADIRIATLAEDAAAVGAALLVFGELSGRTDLLAEALA